MLTLNSALLYIYWKYAPIVLAQKEGGEAKGLLYLKMGQVK
jgi:hypothetical protein